MGLILNGNAPNKIIYNGAEVSLYFNGSKIWPESLSPISSNTVRVRTNDGNAPIKSGGAKYSSATLVAGTTDVYDVYKSGTDFRNLLSYSNNVIEVLGANTTGITNMANMFQRCSSLTTVPVFDTSSVTSMAYMFSGCSSLTTVPLFDTSSVTSISSMFQDCSSLTTVPLFDTSSADNMMSMFYNCSSLTTVPLFDTSNVTYMGSMFYNCYKVESGALALYQQASTQATPPSSHWGTFYNCGRDTVTGAAELAQIPSDWK
jgi:surface protein